LAVTAAVTCQQMAMPRKYRQQLHGMASKENSVCCKRKETVSGFF